MRTRVSSPLLIGRADELRVMQAAFDRATSATAAVLLGGEAGVGKSRLVDEAIAIWSGSGVRVLTGVCVELGGAGVPFAPLVHIVRALLVSTEAQELDLLLGPARPELARLLPELEQPVSGGAPAGGAGDTARFFDLVRGFIARLAASRRLLIVVEDLHWADQSTLDLVVFLLRTLRTPGVLIMLTFRSDELHRRHPLRPVLGELTRSSSISRIDLEPFGRAEVGEQVHAMLGSEPGPGVVDALFDRSGGNAFLVEELVAAGDEAASQTGLASPLRDLLLSRVERLPATTQEVLRVAATAGLRVRHRLLSAVAEASPAELDAWLRIAVEHHVLTVDQRGDGYCFRHALLREAIYEDILPGERGRLHAACAQALQSHPDLGAGRAGTSSEIAYHYLAAQDLPQAIAAAVKAATDAAETFGYVESQRHLMTVLQLWDQVPDAPTWAGIDRISVLERASVAATSSGDHRRALQLVQDALATMDTTAEAERAALLLMNRAWLRFRLDGDPAMDDRSAAVALLPDLPLTNARARALQSLAAGYYVQSDFPSMRAIAKDAIAVARAVGARDVEANAMGELGNALVYLGETEEGIAMLRAALVASSQLGPLDTGADSPALRAYNNFSDALEALGRYTEAAETALAGLAEAKRLGRARSRGPFLTYNASESLLRLGQWDRAERLILEALELDPVGIDAIGLHTLHATIDACRGNWSAAQEKIAVIHRLLAGTAALESAALPLALVEAEVQREAGNRPRAVQIIDAALDSFDVHDFPRYMWPLVWLAARIEAERYAEDPGSATAGEQGGTSRHQLLRRTAGRLATNAPADKAYAALTVAELIRFDSPDRAVGAWQQAVDAWRIDGDPHRLAYALLGLAESALHASDLAHAQDAVREAMVLASRIGAAPLRDQALALGARATMTPVELHALVPQQSDAQSTRARTAAREGDAPPAGAAIPAPMLSGRERELITLVARGRTDAQIAQQLFISIRTVRSHLDRIRDKTGCRRRADLTRLALDAKLV